MNELLKNPNASSYVEILQQETKECAQLLHTQTRTLEMWLNQYTTALPSTLLSLLHLIKKYGLDPLAEELSVFTYSNGSSQAFITIDGWAKIMNQHPQYGGMSLRESSEEKNGVPIWMECCIYRNDRLLPIVIKEYLDEVKTDHISWIQMPRRMLRHRTIQQCARLAFGISSPEYPDSDIEKPPSKIPSTRFAEQKNTPISQTALLKQKLTKNNDH